MHIRRWRKATLINWESFHCLSHVTKFQFYLNHSQMKSEWLLPPDNRWWLRPLNGYWHRIGFNKATYWHRLYTWTAKGCDHQDLKSTHNVACSSTVAALAYTCPQTTLSKFPSIHPFLILKYRYSPLSSSPRWLKWLGSKYLFDILILIKCSVCRPNWQVAIGYKWNRSGYMSINTPQVERKLWQECRW